jgi:hypothetical protein
MRLACALLAAGSLAATASAASGPRVAHTSDGTRLAQATLLVLRDLGTDWTATASKGKPTGINLSCTGFNPRQSDLREIGAAMSASFKGSDVGPFVGQTTSVYATAQAVRTLWQRAVKPGLVACVAQSLQALEARGVSVTITAKLTPKIGALADRSASYRVVATLVTPKQHLKTYFDVILLASRRTITEVTISSFQKPPPLAWEQSLARLAARRIGAGGPAA